MIFIVQTRTFVSVLRPTLRQIIITKQLPKCVSRRVIKDFLRIQGRGLVAFLSCNIETWPSSSIAYYVIIMYRDVRLTYRLYRLFIYIFDEFWIINDEYYRESLRSRLRVIQTCTIYLISCCKLLLYWISTIDISWVASCFCQALRASVSMQKNRYSVVINHIAT